MNREAYKSEYERAVFNDFLDRTGLNIDRTSIRSGNAMLNEPDLIYTCADGNYVGFELGRLTDPNLKRVVNRWEPINGEYVRTSDPSPEITRKKLEKTYLVTFPVHLLLYKENPIITPDNIIILAIKPLCDHAHSYSKVWFMGKTIEVLYEHG
jgi:hypothetical protein